MSPRGSVDKAPVPAYVWEVMSSILVGVLNFAMSHDRAMLIINLSHFISELKTNHVSFINRLTQSFIVDWVCFWVKVEFQLNSDSKFEIELDSES